MSISGPEVVRSGSELKLDCDYDYMAEEESQLDLKWYFNGSPVPVGVTIDTTSYTIDMMSPGVPVGA